MKGAEIVMCNFDEPTTNAFKDKFQAYLLEVKEENQAHDEIESEEEVDSDDEAEVVPKKKNKSKPICILFNLH
jgi:uncharacterized membrane protein YgaE (UPF0421/DUF939 family)